MDDDDGGSYDSGSTDSGSYDSGSTDSGSYDSSAGSSSSSYDGGSFDSGSDYGSGDADMSSGEGDYDADSELYDEAGEARDSADQELYEGDEAQEGPDAELYDEGDRAGGEPYEDDGPDAELYGRGDAEADAGVERDEGWDVEDGPDSELYDDDEAQDGPDAELYGGRDADEGTEADDVTDDVSDDTEPSNSLDDIDFENTANTPYEQAVIAEMDENGELDIPEEDPNLEDPTFGTQHLPTENSGTFEGERGNSAFVPNSEEARAEMAKYGEDSVEYVDGEPDFSPFTQHETPYGEMDCEVEIGHMTTDRTNPTWEYGDRRPAGTSHDPAYDLGNFAQADNALVDRAIEQDPSLVEGLSPEEEAQLRADMARDIEDWRTSNGYTWHECQDGKTMQLVPTSIHDACRHSGGVSTMRTVQAYGDIRRAD